MVQNNEHVTYDPESKRFSNGESNEEDTPEEEEPTIAAEIDALLDKGFSKAQLQKMGYASTTIRKRLRKRAKQHGLPRPEDRENGGKAGVSLTIKEKEQVLPEWLEGQVGELYDGDEKTRKIFMAGMSIPLLGMRLFAESFKPMLSLMQTYQQGQAEAAKQAQGGAGEVAEETIARAMPFFSEMVKETARASSPNPLQNMMARMLETTMTPLMNNLMGAMIPKQPGQVQQAQGQSSLPPGWVNSEEQK